MCLTSQIYKYILCIVVLSAQELYAIEKMAVAGMGNKKIATTLGLAAVDDEAAVVPLKDTPRHPTQTQTTDTDDTCLPEVGPS